MRLSLLLRLQKLEERGSVEGEEDPGKNAASKPLPEEIFHPVFCEVCDTKLGLYDSDEVFHFWGVIASEP